MLPIAIPAPIFRTVGGAIDHDLNAHYARRLGSTWVRHAVVAGPMGLGEACTPEQRAELVELWMRHVEPARLLVACWTPAEIRTVTDSGIRALAMLAIDTDDELLAALGGLPPLAVAYTNPRYGGSLITPELLAANADRPDMPAALKFSKVTISELANIRQVVGPGVTIIHGSSRRIADSLAAGSRHRCVVPVGCAAQAVARVTVASVQRAADTIQSMLDREPDYWARDNLSRT